jgi:hypothetical protein
MNPTIRKAVGRAARARACPPAMAIISPSPE